MTRGYDQANDVAAAAGAAAHAGLPGKRARTASLGGGEGGAGGGAGAAAAGGGRGLADPLPPWAGPSLEGAEDPFGLHLATPVQRKGSGAGGGAAAGPAGAAGAAGAGSAELPPDIPYDRIPGTTTFLVRRAWLASDPKRREGSTGFITPTRTRELLDQLVHAGLLSWAKPDRLAAAAERLVLLDSGAKGEVVRAALGAGAYNILGLPPGSGAMVSRIDGGLELTVAAPGLEADGEHFPLEPAQLDSAFDAIERFTQLTIPTERRGGVLINARGGVGTFRIFLSRDNMSDLVGEAAWRSFGERGGAAAGARDAAGAGASVNGDLTDLELERARQWLRANLPTGKDEGVRIDRALLEVILRIERSPHRARIIAALAGGEGGVALTALSVEAVVHEATYEAERDAMGVEAPRPTADLDPVHDTPLPARIVQHAGKIAAGDTVPFTIEVDWPPVLIDRAQGDEYRYRQFVTSVDWVFEKVGGGEKRLGKQRYTGGTEAFDHTFQLAPGEPQATWTVHAFVRHSHFQPAHVQRAVVVQTEAALMRDLRDEATAGMGSLYQDAEKKNFDTGVVNNRLGSEAQDKGLSFHGRLPPGFQQTTDAERDQRRQAEMEQVRAMIAHLRGRDVWNTEAISAAERYLANLERTDRQIEADATAGWQSFEVRGTLRSKKAGVDDGALALHGSLRRDGEGFIVVQLRDLSRRFGAEDLRTDGKGSDFAEALEEAFVPLCKAYPPGRLFILAQDHQGLRPMSTTIGFELDTGTVGEDIKAKVWDPAVKIAVNLAGLAAALAGFGAITLPALAVYNGLETVDQLHEEYARGTLSTTDVALGLAGLALDALPAAGRLKAVGGSARGMFMLSLADKAGEVLYLTASAHAQILELEELQVAQLVEQWERLVELQATTDAADPAMRAMQAEFDAQADKVKQSTARVLLDLASQRALFVAAKHVGMNVVGPGGRGIPRWESLHRQGLFELRPDGEPYYDPATGKMVGNPRTITDGQLDALEAARADHMRLLSGQLAERLTLPATDVEVMVGDKVVVKVGKTGGVTATYQPGVPPDKVLAGWREQYDGIMAARAAAAGEAADEARGAPPREHLPAGEPGAPRPRRNHGEPYGEHHPDPGSVDGTGLPTPNRHLAKHELARSNELGVSVRTQWAEIEALTAGGNGVPVGRVLATADEGHVVLDRLRRGDADAVRELGVSGMAPRFDPLQQEWDLIETSDGFLIVAGDYASVKLDGRVRSLGHIHPAPRKGGKPGQITTKDLVGPEGGQSYEQVLASAANRKHSGLAPSREDIHAISDGGAHVLYTRYVNAGDGLIANPQPDDPRPRIEIHMEGAHVRRWHPATKVYYYQVAMRVKDTNGDILWAGKGYARWVATNMSGEFYPTIPDELQTPLPEGWRGQ